MFIIAVTEKPSTPARDLLAVDRQNLDLCPHEVEEADFLQTMTGWL